MTRLASDGTIPVPGEFGQLLPGRTCRPSVDAGRVSSARAELPAATRPTREDWWADVWRCRMPDPGLSEACLGRDAAGRNGLTQSVVVTLVLVGVGLRE